MYDDIQPLLKEIAAGEDTYLEFKEVVFRGNRIQFAREAGRATLADLDRTRFATYYQRRFGRSLHEADLPWERLLAGLKLASRVDEKRSWDPTNLGLLLFAERPDRWISGAYVDIAVYAHGEANGDTEDTRRIYGPVPEQIESALDYLRTSPFLTTVSRKEETGRVDRPAYSRWALQEAVVNALVHRSYQLRGSQVRIFLFPDRIEVWSPGGLHNTLTPEDLYAGCQPIRRNQLLAGFLRDYESPATGTKHMETRGEGFLNLVRESERVSGRRPELRVQGEAVCLTIFAAYTPGELAFGSGEENARDSDREEEN